MRRTSAKNKQNEKRNENLKFLFEVITFLIQQKKFIVLSSIGY